MNPQRRLEAEQVKALLASQSADLLTHLLPGGRMVSGEYRSRGPDGSLWAVQVTGSKAGNWISGQAGLAGRSYLSLIRDIACEGDHLRAYKFALRFIGEDTAALPRAIPRAVRPVATSDPAENGLGIYLHADEFNWNNPVGRYLQGRGIEPELFDRPLRVLRYHPALYNAECQAKLPGMLAAIVDPATSRQIALHRTWLDYGPPWRKARLAAPKKVRGPFGGGLIPLTRGPSGRAWRKAPEGDWLLLAEGIENALAVAGDEPEYRSAAYVSANNLLQLRLPAAFKKICLVVDRDGENWSVTEDREIALEQWRIEGRSVGVWEPPEGVKDAADYVKETSAWISA